MFDLDTHLGAPVDFADYAAATFAPPGRLPDGLRLERGGSEVLLTYASGQDDAQRVADEIQSAGLSKRF